MNFHTFNTRALAGVAQWMSAGLQTETELGKTEVNLSKVTQLQVEELIFTSRSTNSKAHGLILSYSCTPK